EVKDSTDSESDSDITETASTSLTSTTSNTANDEQSSDSILWHNRLGHLAHSSIKKLIDAQCVNGLEKVKIKDSVNANNSLCEGCIYGKSHRKQFGHSIAIEYQAKDIMDRVRPININSAGDPITLLYNGKYLLIIIDEKSRKIFGF